jgi:hypothetical protein
MARYTRNIGALRTVQRAQISIASAEGSNDTATVTSVDTDRTIVKNSVGNAASSTDPRNNFARGNMAADDTVSVTRDFNGGSYTWVQAYIYEFNGPTTEAGT